MTSKPGDTDITVPKSPNGGNTLQGLAHEAVDKAVKATGEEAVSYADVAIAALCNSYAYAQAMAFQEEVLNKERWDIVMQAAFCRTVARIEENNPEEVQEQLKLLKQAMAVFEQADAEVTNNLQQIAIQFKEATQLLMDVKDQTEVG